MPDPSTIVCKLPHVGEGCARCHTRLTREALERMREAGTLAERMNDERRRNRVSALMTKVHSSLGEVEEALASGTRALEIAERLGDLRLRILATSYLAQAYHYRGEHERLCLPRATSLCCAPTGFMRISD